MSAGDVSAGPPARPAGLARLRLGVARLARRARRSSGSGARPRTRSQKEAQRLMYLHVPAAWLAYLAFGVTALASALFLWPRTRSLVWDRLAGASAELGVLFTALTLVLGSLWGKPVWGVWWAWDARLVTTAVLFFLYLGYLALRRIPGETRSGAASATRSPRSSRSSTCRSCTSRSSGGGRCTRRRRSSTRSSARTSTA